MVSNSGEENSISDLIKNYNEWFNYFKSKWKIILFVGIIGGAVGLSYSILKKTKYIASLSFALEEKTASTSGLSSIASSFGLNIGGGEGGAFAGDNLIELMKSRFLIEKTLLTKVNVNGESLTLIHYYIAVNKLKENWKNNPYLSKIDFNNINRNNFSRLQDSVIGKIATDILINDLDVYKLDKKLSIIITDYTSNDELLSKLFCENLVRNVADFYVETKIGKSKVNVKILESRVDSVKLELDNAMFGRANFVDKNQGLIRQSAIVPKLKQEIKIQMLSTLYTELVKNLELSKLQLMRDEPLIQIIDSPILPLSKIRVSKSKAIIVGVSLFEFFLMMYLTLKKLLSSYL